MQSLQQPIVQCLDLSRPESISTAGYCADVQIQATRYPQPMLYSPGNGALVTFEPQRRSGIREQQWIDTISKPKHVTKKYGKATPCPHRPRHSHQQQQQQQQQHCCPQTPAAQQEQLAVLTSPSIQEQGGHRQALPPAVSAVLGRSVPADQAAVAEAAEFVAACQQQRGVVSQSRAFSWGGRIKDKHAGLSKMNTTAAGSACAAAQTRKSESRQADGACALRGAEAVAEKEKRHVHAAAAAHPSAAVDAQVAAHAAVLGQNADRLFTILQRRQQQRQQERHLHGLGKEAKASRGTAAQQQRQHKAITKGPLREHRDEYGGIDMHERIGQQYIRL